MNQNDAINDVMSKMVFVIYRYNYTIYSLFIHYQFLESFLNFLINLLFLPKFHSIHGIVSTEIKFEVRNKSLKNRRRQ